MSYLTDYPVAYTYGIQLNSNILQKWEEWYNINKTYLLSRLNKNMLLDFLNLDAELEVYRQSHMEKITSAIKDNNLTLEILEQEDNILEIKTLELSEKQMLILKSLK
jgi:hypothetical protein